MARFRRNGSVVAHHGYWFYSVRLPGEKRRRMLALRAPGAKHGLPADRPRRMAEQAAARLWEEATRERRELERAGGCTVEELCAAYCAWAPTYYRRPDGSPTSEVANVVAGVRLFRELFGKAAVSEMTHSDMLRLRDALVRTGVSRVTVNRRLSIVRRMMAWALDEAMIPASAKAELTQVANLRRGRSAAPERPPVAPVDDAAFERTVAEMMPNTADMARVQRLTGMRPEEVCAFAWSRVDETREPWVYRPEENKNGWRGAFGLPRVVCIGPKARAVLERHRGAERPFSPARAVAEWMAAKRAARTSPFYPCRDESFSRAAPHAVRKPGTRWTTAAYTRSIHAACVRAGVEPWGANRLRHSFATEVRRRFGLEACRAVLGHSDGSRITDRYSFEAIEDEIVEKAAPAVEALG